MILNRCFIKYRQYIFVGIPNMQATTYNYMQVITNLVGTYHIQGIWVYRVYIWVYKMYVKINLSFSRYEKNPNAYGF